MFGFMEKSHDHEGWIQALDALMPFVCMSAVSPSYVRPLILASSLVVPGTMRALKSLDVITKSARSTVAKRFRNGAKAEEQRSDIAEQLYTIHTEKGEKVDFGLGDIEQEAYVAL